MPNNMVTIHADILKVTPKFVTVRCGESEEILKLWEVEADEPLEAGQVDMALRIPKAEADALGLSVAEEMESAPESSLEEPEEADSNTHTEPTDLCLDETPEDEASPGLTVDANAADVPPTLPDESSQGAALQ